MDYSRPSRIVKLSGLPEVLLQSDRPARIIDASARPSTTSVRQRARPAPTPAGLGNYKPSSASLSPPLTRHKPPSQPAPQSFRPQAQPRHQQQQQQHQQQQQTNYPQSLFGQSATTTTTTATATKRRGTDSDQSNHTNYLQQHHHQQHQKPQQRQNHNQQHQKHHINNSRSCTPNILHQANKFASPQKQTQRRAVSLSPTNQYSLIAECIQTLKQLSVQFETFVTKSEHEKSNLSDTTRPPINQERQSPIPSPSYQQHSQTHSTQTDTLFHPQHHNSHHQQQAPQPVAPPPIHQNYLYHQPNRPWQQQYYQHPSVIHEEEQQQYLLGQKQWYPSAAAPPQPQPRHHLPSKCHGRCNCYNCLVYHTKQYPTTRVAATAAAATTNCVDADDDGPANLSMASREYLSRYNLA